MRVQLVSGVFVPIGNRGWYSRGAERAIYDQQPVEASCMTETAIAAFRSTENGVYRQEACQIFEWFLGRNLNGLPVYDEEMGACCDGLTPTGLNLNRGAEAVVTYLQARLSMEEISRAPRF